ncbi:MAG: site-specific integrase [Planctomycetaceae bacterium]|nr:site-specific integrase [Planctomycetaceae bacterium]
MNDEKDEHNVIVAGADDSAYPAVKHFGRDMGEDVGQKVSDLLAGVFAVSGGLTGPVTPATALVPWVSDVLLSEHFFRAYGRDLADFVEHMERLGVDPPCITADHVRLYKGAMLKGGLKPTTVARRLSVLRGVYRRHSKRGQYA